MRAFVHRYKWSHDRRRRQMHRLVKDGRAQILETVSDGWWCEFPDNFPLAKTK